MQNYEYITDANGVQHMVGFDDHIIKFYNVDAEGPDDLWDALRAFPPPRGGSGCMAVLICDFSCDQGEAQYPYCEMWIYADGETCNEDGNYGYILKPDAIGEDEAGRWKSVWPGWWWFPRNEI